MEERAQMKKILVANSDRSEAHWICQRLLGEYEIIILEVPANYDLQEHRCDLILLDTNFTCHQGIDFLMEVASRKPLPILAVIPMDDPLCAVETIRAGAFNYVIKTPSYLDLLNHAIADALNRFEEVVELKRMVYDMSRRISELEITTHQQPASVTAAPGGSEHPLDYRKQLAREVITRLRSGEINIPSYPQINIRLSHLINESAPIDQVIGLLKEDISIVTKLIRLCNSPPYSVGPEIKTLEQAIRRLGLKQTKNVVEIVSNRSLFTSRSAKHQDLLMDIWKHSVASAHGAELVARRLSMDAPDEVFTMGLVHDIGFVVLLQIVADLEHANSLNMRLDNATVVDFLKAQHCSFGRAILLRWKLPEMCATVAMHHEHLSEDQAHPPELLAVHLANLVALDAGYGLEISEKDGRDPRNSLSARALGLRAEFIDEIASEVSWWVEHTASAAAL